MLLYDGDGSLSYNLANNYMSLRSGKYYTLITSMFLHADIIHIAFNMYALYILGPQVEKYYGKCKFLLMVNKKADITILNEAYMQNISGKWYVLFFYVLNLVMVGADLCLYVRNYRLDKANKI